MERSLHQTTTWWLLALNNKADKDSHVPNRRNNTEIPQSLSHHSLCSHPVCSICISPCCGLHFVWIVAGKKLHLIIMQNSNAGHAVEVLIFLSILMLLFGWICIEYNFVVWNKKKHICLHILVMASGNISNFHFRFHFNGTNSDMEIYWHLEQQLVFKQSGVCSCKLAHTGILPSFISVYKAGNQHNECEESDGTHQADKPSLGWYSSMDAGQTWGEQNPVTLTRLGLFIRTLDWMFTIDKAHLMQRQEVAGHAADGNGPILILNS